MRVTLSAIDSAYFNANDLGKISPKSKINKVTIPVDIPIAVVCSNHHSVAKFILILVANDAAVMLTILFPINMVTNNLSLFSLSFLSINAVLFHFFICAFILWKGIFINANSVPEKKADPNMSRIKTISSPEYMVLL